MKTAKYTLVELLVVIGIIGVIIGVAMPAFVKMAKGSGVGLQASALASKFKQARDYAIANRTYAALIMPDPTTTGGSYALPETDMLYTSYRVAEVYLDANTHLYTFRKWADTSWSRTQTGTAIADVTSGAWTPIYGVDLRDIQDSAGQLSATSNPMARCILIKPYGSLLTASPLTIKLQEATNINGSLTVTNTANFSTFNVNPFTGGVKFSQ